MIEDPSLVLIGSTARNSGKTTLALALAQLLGADYPLAALKVTRITDESSGCPHGEQGCGLCEQFEGSFCLERETNDSSGKDTSLLLASGLEHVYWLKTREEALVDAYRVYMHEAGSGRLTICESNCLREHVQPLVFIMLAADSCEPKPSAQAVMKHADFVIPSSQLFADKMSVAERICDVIRKKYHLG